MMNTRFSRRTFLKLAGTSGVLATIPSLSSVAGDSDAENIAPRYPLTGFSDDWEAFKHYEPSKDKDASFYRSRVKLAPRIDAFRDTQAHPALKPEISAATLFAAYLTLSGEDKDYNRTRYLVDTNARVHVERAWQYQDIAVGWNTTGLIPNAALVDAAHRNGVKCLGTIFQPDRRLFDGSDLSRPEVAARLVAFCDYFGFDGYFVNFESYTAKDATQVQDLIEEMQKAAVQQALSNFHVQYYDGYTDVKSVWPGPEHADGSKRQPNALRANSMMIDQGWSNYGLTKGCCSGYPLKKLHKPALKSAYDITDVYYGFQLYPGPGYFGLMAPTVITPNGGKALGGLQIYSVEDGLRKMRRARFDQLKASSSLTTEGKEELLSLTDPALTRKSWYHLHGQFWAGQSGNPAAMNAPTSEQLKIYGPANVRKIYTDYQTPGKPTDQIRLPITYGVANFISERSVIGSLPFVTNFNTGEGDHFYMAGKEVASTPWFNLGIQDILPSWAWWRMPLSKPTAANIEDTLLNVDYDFSDAYEGGSSLCVSGSQKTTTATEVRLFKTKLKLEKDTTLGVIYKGGQGGNLSVGLIFEDAPNTTDWVELSQSAGQGWQDWQHALTRHIGRTIAAISLGVKGNDLPNFKLNIGRISLYEASPAVTALSVNNFKIENTKISSDKKAAELRLSWEYDSNIQHYDIFAIQGASKTWLGRIVGDSYYVSNLRNNGEGSTKLQLVPTASGAMISQSAQEIDFTW